MASSSSVTNDERKHRILNVYPQFVSDVDPERLSDYLLQGNVITIEQWQRICLENPVKSERCRALLSHLFCTQHPRAFVVVYNALRKENHFLLEFIDNQEPGSGIRVQYEKRTVLQEKEKMQQLEKDNEEQKRALEAEKHCRLKVQKEYEDQKRAWDAEKNRLLEMQNKHDDQKKQWKEERDRFHKIRKELEASLHLETTEAKKNAKENSQSTELRSAEQEIRNLRARIQKLENDLKLKDSVNAQPAEKERRAHELESESSSENLQNYYKSDPVLVQTIKTNASKQGKGINGLTILDKELFVVTGKSSEVEVYDSIKLSFSRQWNLNELLDPRDIGSCNRNKCLYIADYKDIGRSKEILRVDPNGKLIKKWSTGDGYGWGLSVTDEANIILTVYNNDKLHEYSPDGQLIRQINLSSDSGIRRPWHAIKLANGHFVVSHGYFHAALQRVCLVDAAGKLKKSISGKYESACELTCDPVYFAVDRNGFVLVADRYINGVLLFDSDLEFKRSIYLKDKHMLRDPSRILLDESNCRRRLFVADNIFNSKSMSYRDGQILILDFQ